MYVLVYRIRGTNGATGGEVAGFSTEANAVAAGNKIQDRFSDGGTNVWYAVIHVD